MGAGGREPLLNRMQAFWGLHEGEFSFVKIRRFKSEVQQVSIDGMAE
jgi:hypothetical protein